MEAVGFAAGIVGFASLAIQLADSAVKLQDQYHSYRQAPKEVQSLIEELQLLSLLLKQLTATEQTRQPATTSQTLLQQCMRWCTSIKDTLLDVTEALEAELKLNRRKASVRFVFKKGSVDEWLEKLERAKSTLLLCQHLCTAEASHNQIGDLQAVSASALARQDLTNEGIAQLRTQSLTTATNLDALAVDFRNAWDLQQGRDVQRDQRLDSLERTIMAISQHLHTSPNTEVTYMVGAHKEKVNYILTRWKVPRPWQYKLRLRLPLALCQTQWEVQVVRAISGWNLSLRFPVIVPENEYIWDLCDERDLHDIQRLLSSNEMSLYSEQLDGTTLLHTAAMLGNIDLCQFLISQGLEPLQVDKDGFTPFDYALVVMWREDVSAFSRLLECFKSYVVTDSGHPRLESTRRAFLLDRESLEETDVVEALMYLPQNFHPGDGSALLQDIVEELLKKDSQILIRSTPDGFSPLHFAASQMLRLEHSCVVVLPYYRDLAIRAIQAGQSTTQIGTTSWTDYCALHWCSPLGHCIQGLWVNGLINVPPHSRAWYRFFDSALRNWIAILADTGVDIAAYGAIELLTFRAARDNALRSLASRGIPRTNTAIFPWIAPTFFLSQGSELNDWRFWQLHPGDEFCGDFWHLIERPLPADEIAFRIAAIKHCRENVACDLPGSWNECLMGSGKPIRCLTELTLKVAKLDNDEFYWLISVLNDEEANVDVKYSILGLNTWILADVDNCKNRSWQNLSDVTPERAEYIYNSIWAEGHSLWDMEPTSTKWEDFALEKLYGCRL